MGEQKTTERETTTLGVCPDDSSLNQRITWAKKDKRGNVHPLLYPMLDTAFVAEQIRGRNDGRQPTL